MTETGPTHSRSDAIAVTRAPLLPVLFALAIGLAIPTLSLAGVRLGGTSSYWQESFASTDATTGATISQTQTTRYPFDVLGGYEFGFGLWLGGAFHYGMGRDETGVGATQRVRSGVGPSLGYVSGGFWLLGAWLFAPRLETTTASITTVYTGGQAFLLQLGYGFEIVGPIRLGPQLTFRRFKFDTRAIGAAASTRIDTVDRELTPGIGLWIIL